MMELLFDDKILEGLQYAADREGIKIETFCHRILSNIAADAYQLKRDRDKKIVVEMIDKGEIKAADCIALKAVEKPIEDPIVEDPIKEDPIIEEPIIKDGGV